MSDAFPLLPRLDEERRNETRVFTLSLSGLGSGKS